MRKRAALSSLLAVCVAVLGCTPATTTPAFRSLESSGTAAFICAAYTTRTDGTVEITGFRDIKSCPDTDPVDGETRQTYALVTQTTRGEVALLGINATDSTTGKILSGFVVDVEPSVPGFNFLPVGSEPTDIVATPGSAATFVASAEVGKEGIYALPTQCVFARRKDSQRRTDPKTKKLDPVDPVRDITLWPACHLPAAPGKMTMLVDPPVNGLVRTSCDEPKPVAPDGGSPDGGAPDSATPPHGAGWLAAGETDESTVAAQARSQCPANLETEEGPQGRRKLVVSLPELGKLVVIDAQALLNRPAGAFGPCPIDATVTLNGVITPVEPILQKLPSDLNNVFPAGLPHPAPPPGGYEPHPEGFARVDDPSEHTLYVADSTAPVIHKLDTSDPCTMTELPPLLPVSYFDPARTVTTTKVAVMSQLTVGGTGKTPPGKR